MNLLVHYLFNEHVLNLLDAGKTFCAYARSTRTCTRRISQSLGWMNKKIRKNTHILSVTSRDVHDGF